jgi:hypothetical protein
VQAAHKELQRLVDEKGRYVRRHRCRCRTRPPSLPEPHAPIRVISSRCSRPVASCPQEVEFKKIQDEFVQWKRMRETVVRRRAGAARARPC